MCSFFLLSAACAHRFIHFSSQSQLQLNAVVEKKKQLYKNGMSMQRKITRQNNNNNSTMRASVKQKLWSQQQKDTNQKKKNGAAANKHARVYEEKNKRGRNGDCV